MKALILKEFFSIQQHLKMVLFITLIFMVASFIFGDANLLLTFATVLCSVQITTSFTNDEMSKWNQFAGTLPIKKADIVKSKYVFSILLTSFFMVLVLPVMFLTNYFVSDEPMQTSIIFSILCIAISAIMIMHSILFPVYIKFGTQKGRIFLLLVVFIPVISANLLMDSLNELLSQFSMETLQFASYLSPFVSLIIFAISYFIAVNLYENKEF